MAAFSRSDAELATKTDLKQEIAAFKADLTQEIRAVRAAIAAIRADFSVSRSEQKAALNAAVRKMVFGQIAVAVWLFVAIKLF